jgi:hypothetical protein
VADAVGQALSFAVGVAISPAAVVAAVLMLATPRARSNGIAFVVGWVAGVAALGAVVLLVAGGADASEQGAPADWVGALKGVVGLLLLGVAARRWRARPRGDEQPEPPAWMKTVDGFAPPRAAGVGALLAAVNPKNALLVVGGAAAIAQTGASTGSQAAALAVFAAVAALGVGTPVALHLALGARSQRTLDRLRERMVQGNAAIVAVLCLVIGAKLIGDAISVLA